MKVIQYYEGRAEVVRLLGYALIYELCKRATSQRSYEVETASGLLRVYKTIDRATGNHYYHVYFYAKRSARIRSALHALRSFLF